jgi:hypothetical protein
VNAETEAARVAPANGTAETKKVSATGQRKPETKLAKPRSSAARTEVRIVPKGT